MQGCNDGRTDEGFGEARIELKSHLRSRLARVPRRPGLENRAKKTGLADVEDLNRMKGSSQGLLIKLTVTENLSATASPPGSFDISVPMMPFD